MLHRQPDRKFDLRTLERSLAKGKITPEEYEAHLASLPDVGPKVADFHAQFVEGILDTAKAAKAAKAAALQAELDALDDDDEDDEDDDEDDDDEDED